MPRTRSPDAEARGGGRAWIEKATGRIISARRLRTVAVAAGVGVGYYVGALMGLALRLPSTTPSLIWPPNAILTATLLSTPPREWPIYLIAVLPGHLLTELAAGWPLPLILSLYVTNCGEAVLAGVTVRLFSDAPERFDTFQRFGIFV